MAYFLPKGSTIALDYGHLATPDRGASGILSEETCNRETGDILKSLLENNGYKVIVVTPFGQTFGSVTQSLRYRVNKANEAGVDFYIAIHYNCFNSRAYGSEVFCVPGGKGETIAGQVLDGICSEIGTFKRGVKYNNLYVTKYTDCPAILTEGLFIDNESDAKKYDPKKIAIGIFKGVTGINVDGGSVDYTPSEPVKPVTPPSTGSDDTNAVCVNDFLYGRDSNGNRNGKAVYVGDRIKVIDVSYSKQLALVEYPTPHGKSRTWVTNAVGCIKYDRVNCGYALHDTGIYELDSYNKIGSLYRFERGTLLDTIGDYYNIVYDTSKGVRTKSGLIKKDQFVIDK